MAIPDRGQQAPVETDQRRPILCCFGTRPEIVKLFPVIERLRRERLATILLNTGQHRSLADDALRTFGLAPDVDLDVMRPGQSPSLTASRILGRATEVLDRIRPRLVLVQGDTTSAMTMALAGAYRQIEVVHVEAGLRSYDRRQPFPEELNRQLIATLATQHFAPTDTARTALLGMGVDGDAIVVSGNTIVDAQQWALDRLARSADPPIASCLDRSRPTALLTVHRQENQASGLDGVIAAIRRLDVLRPELQFLLPAHPNPAVSGRLVAGLGTTTNTVITEAIGYLDLIWILSRCTLVLTDSGGLQEEAPPLGKPVVVLRERTERPEGIEAGMARLVGTDPDRIVEAVIELLDRPPLPAVSPYGDGRASQRIVDALLGRPVEEFRSPAGGLTR